jgi:hypothetical protein
VRYNVFHDQLVLTSGSDARVVLTSVASLSSEPFGKLLADERDNDEGTFSIFLIAYNFWAQISQCNCSKMPILNMFFIIK